MLNSELFFSLGETSVTLRIEGRGGGAHYGVLGKEWILAFIWIINRTSENFLGGGALWCSKSECFPPGQTLNSSLNKSLHEPTFKANMLNIVVIILRSYFINFSVTVIITLKTINIYNSMQAIVNSQMKWSKFSDIQGN